LGCQGFDLGHDRIEAIETLKQQGQPIVVPYGTGKVLVHPTNPCIQQYIP
jgi:hypothetical protein